VKNDEKNRLHKNPEKETLNETKKLNERNMLMTIKSNKYFKYELQCDILIFICEICQTSLNYNTFVFLVHTERR
jgi:hypothetical protein